MRTILFILFVSLVKMPFAGAMEEPTHVRGKIRSLTQIFEYIVPGTVVFLDLDQTAFTKLSDENDRRILCGLEPIEIGGIANVVEKVKTFGAKVFGLTSRKANEKSFRYTRADLRAVGLVFDTLLDAVSPLPYYNAGVFFTSGQLKGKILTQLMENPQLREFLNPVQKIIFVDDREDQVNSVASCFFDPGKLAHIPSIIAHSTAALGLEEAIMQSAYQSWNRMHKDNQEDRLSLDAICHICTRLRKNSEGCFPTNSHIMGALQEANNVRNEIKSCLETLEMCSDDEYERISERWCLTFDITDITDEDLPRHVQTLEDFILYMT